MGCCCLGPQNGEPLCPCQMAAARLHIERFPQLPPILTQQPARGCVCPAGAEATCQGFCCPRKPISLTF